MGRVASIAYSDNSGKAIYVRKRRRGYELIRYSESKPDFRHIKGFELALSYYYPDLILEKVTIPPAGDRETASLLIRRYLAQERGINQELLMCWDEMPEESTEESSTYRVFAIPDEVYAREDVLPAELREKVSIFSLSQFAPAGISALVAGDLVVMHVYSDREKLIITVSQEDEVFYTRTVAVPSYLLEGGDINGFLQENVQTTYVFVAQRQGIKVDLILLSGIAKDGDEFVKSLGETVSVGIATPVVPPELKGVDCEVFHDFMLCFGTLFQGDRYDFTPQDIKDRRTFMKYASKIVPIVLVGLIALLSLFSIEIYRLKGVRDEILKRQEKLRKEILSIANDPFVKDPAFEYYGKYLGKINSARKNNLFIPLLELGDLILRLKPERYGIGIKNGKWTLALEATRRFGTVVEMKLFMEKFRKDMEKYTKKGFKYQIGNVRRDDRNLTISFTLLMEKKV